LWVSSLTSRLEYAFQHDDYCRSPRLSPLKYEISWRGAPMRMRRKAERPGLTVVWYGYTCSSYAAALPQSGIYAILLALASGAAQGGRKWVITAANRHRDAINHETICVYYIFKLTGDVFDAGGLRF
jgi:hypothetical protein